MDVGKLPQLPLCDPARDVPFDCRCVLASLRLDYLGHFIGYSYRSLGKATATLNRVSQSIPGDVALHRDEVL